MSGDASVSLSISSSGPNAGSANYTFGTPPAPAFIPPPSQSTPEPGTIIGLVAVGAGALVSRRRKDSK